jgi:hypothetical protein
MELGKKEDGSPLIISVESLLRHVVVLGASGSGKTVCCKVMVEEAVRKGIPIIAIDPQGDIASLAEIGDADVAIAKGVPGQTMLDWYDKADVKIWTPASTLGIPLSISPNTDIPEGAREEDRIRAFGALALSLTEMIGAGRKAEEMAAAFAMILEYADKHRLLIGGLGDFADFLEDPPRPLREDLDFVVNAKSRESAAKAFRGQPINVPALLGLDGHGEVGKTRVSVVYLNTLANAEEKEMFIGVLCNAVYTWMLSNPSPTPQALFYIDEVAPYIPPVKKPACKDSLMLLLRQARKYGVSMILATQSPGDLDYKALGQIGTWMIGRMRSPQEAYKIHPALSAQPNVDADAICDRLPSFDQGQFVVTSPDNFPDPEEFRVRWLVSAHRTVAENGVEDLVSASDRERLG